jgi:hypothetical protein
LSADIFKFWSQIKDGENVHPADREVLSNSNHHFDLSGLPGSFMGPLKTAPVVLLYLAPGTWAPEDSLGERASEVRLWHSRTRAGCEPLPGSKYSVPTQRWWSSKTRLFGDPQALSSKIAFLNIASYHSSGDFRDYGLLGKLPSSITTSEWARSVLFPAARNKERVVLCLRSAQYWGLTVGYDQGWLFAPRFTRSGHMHHGQAREAIVETVREVLRTNN